MERLASETAMEKEIPPEIEIITRRVLLDRLAARGLREGLDGGLLDLLLAPDGHWTTAQKQRASEAWECLYVFRWVLGLGELPDLSQNPRYSAADTGSVFEVKEPEKLAVLPSWDIRPARNGAYNYLNRCWAELVSRRAIKSAQEEDVERALGFREEIKKAGYTGDFLIEHETIAEAETPLLFLICRRAFHRWQMLALMVDVMAGDAPTEKLREHFAQYFAPEKDSASEDTDQAENTDSLTEATAEKDT
jgi:hypothetical protein